MPNPTNFKTIGEIKSANAARGSCFFDPKSMADFDSTIYPKVYGGRYFVTSEQHHPSRHAQNQGVESQPRRYKIRRADSGGVIYTLSGIHATLGEAKSEAKRIAGLVRYRAEFTACEIGAIGVPSFCRFNLSAVDEEAARLALYDRWEHVHGLTLSVIL